MTDPPIAPAPLERHPLPPRELGFLSSESIPRARDFAGNAVHTTLCDPLSHGQQGAAGQFSGLVPPPMVYKRDPFKLNAYLVPYPWPQLSDCVPSDAVPQRFLIYTPPSRPFASKPKKDALPKEDLSQWCRRKWLEELREAKTRQSKSMTETTSLWRRGKWKATLAVDWGIDRTKSSNLEFLNRAARMQDEADAIAEDCYHSRASPEEIVVFHPSSLTDTLENGRDDKWLREEFIASLLRTRKRATRDTIIAALLLLPSIVVDTLIIPVWPFGGLAEIDAVWLYASLRGAKASRAITRRLNLTTDSTEQGHNAPKKRKQELYLSFTVNDRLHVLQQYLAAKCHETDAKQFPGYVQSPGEAKVLEAIAWSHSADVAEMSWEDRQWEMQQAKTDLKRTFAKGAREWSSLCRVVEKKAEKDGQKAEQ